MRLLLISLLSLAATAAQSTCPTLSPGWGNYSATQENGLCVYRDVRFASPPVGELRFAAPEYPPADGSPPPVKNPGCIAMTENACSVGTPPNCNGCFGCTVSTETEDCLFLDIYVPLSVATGHTKVPVIVWFYGGAYVFGSKTQYDPTKIDFYGGDGITTAGRSDGPVIYVAANYRLGAFGWLAGDYMEKNAQPNAGLLDQNKALQFVQDHISQLNGDNSKVTVWGESAGASSILHHLVMPQNVNAKKPLFHQALLQSPAYQWLWDRTGDLNKTFTNFATQVARAAGCKAADINCLRSSDATTDILKAINQALFQEVACYGIIPVGPAVDGNLVLDIPSNVFANPSNVMKLDSIVVSHVDLEVPVPNPKDLSSFSFIPYPIREQPQNKTKFDDFLNEFFTGDAYKSVRDSIRAQYPSANYKSQIERAQHTIMDSSFLCNTRVVIDAYVAQKKPVYALDYAFGNSIVRSLENKANHASDLLPTFVSTMVNYTALFACEMTAICNPDGTGLLCEATRYGNFVSQQLGPGLQSYFVSHALHGNPNQGATGKAANHQWAQAQINSDGEVINVMKPTFPWEHWNLFHPNDPFVDNSIVDEQNSQAVCGFWKQIAADVSAAYKSESRSSTGQAEEQFFLHTEL